MVANVLAIGTIDVLQSPADLTALRQDLRAAYGRFPPPMGDASAVAHRGRIVNTGSNRALPAAHRITQHSFMSTQWYVMWM